MLKHKLRAARKTAHFTQAELAQRTGSAPSAISHWESGHRKPDVDNLVKLCRALACSSDWLLGLPVDDTGDRYRRYRVAVIRAREALELAPNDTQRG